MNKTSSIITRELSEADWLNTVKLVIEFMKSQEVPQAIINYDFILEKDLQSKPQPAPKTIALTSLYNQIELDMGEGIIEYGGSTDCRIDFGGRLSMILNNDCFVMLETSDATLLGSIAMFLRSHQVDTFTPSWPATPPVTIVKGSLLDRFLSIFRKRKGP